MFLYMIPPHTKAIPQQKKAPLYRKQGRFSFAFFIYVWYPGLQVKRGKPMKKAQPKAGLFEWSAVHSDVVPVVGVEPTRYCYHRILSPARLPIPPYRRIMLYYIIQ